jgi:hypothetical protein
MDTSVIQFDFSGGMYSGRSATAIASNQYAFGRNLRVSPSGPQAIRKPVMIRGDLPEGSIQNFAIAGNFIVVFIRGKCYYRDLTNSVATYNVVENFQMDEDAATVYTCLVPASRHNASRQLTGSIINLANKISGTPSALLVQDGISQPRIILADGSSRITQNYQEWSLTNREYVPVSKQMVWDGGILFAVSPDNKYIYRSVTGKPLDFLVAVSNTGDKIGDASTTAHTVDYNIISNIFPASSPGSVRIGVSSLQATRMMVAGDAIFYGEPLFSNPLVMASGGVNSEAVADIGGGTAIIDGSGLRAFNATKQLLTESNNDVFSLPVSSFFGNITDRTNVVQDIVAAVNFDNHALFAVKTIYGYGVLVYDLAREAFVSFDQYAGIGAIKAFRVAKLEGIYKLYFSTIDGSLYEAFASDEYETATLYTKEATTTAPTGILNCIQVAAQFSPILSSGIVSASVISDRLVTNLGAYNASVVPGASINYPLDDNIVTRCSPFIWKPFSMVKGYAVGLRLSWAFGGPLQSTVIKLVVDNGENPRNAVSSSSNLIR